jgi:hypothetical protein
MKIEDIETLIVSANTNLDRADNTSLIHHQATYLNAASANALVAIAEMMLADRKKEEEPKKTFPWDDDHIGIDDYVMVATNYANAVPSGYRNRTMKVGIMSGDIAYVENDTDGAFTFGIPVRRLQKMNVKED